METWKNINQFKKTTQTIKLEISNFGNIKRTTPKGLITISTGSNSNGYKRVRINKKKYFVHRLVLETFIGECPEGKPYCDHKDRNPSNNHIDNLHWVSGSENNLNRNPFKRKNKTGCIRKTKSGTYQFRFFFNKQRKSQTFKTEIEARNAQAFYFWAIDIIE